MSISIPSFYEEIPSPAVTVEANQGVQLPEIRNPDLLPFQALGGRRFEILAYLYLLDAPPEKNATVTLVKSSGDKGRDVVVHSNGKLHTIVQCKALEDTFTRPALVRELVKLALFDHLEKFIPDAGIEYQIWAPGGLTEQVSALIAEWPNSLTQEEVKAAFDITVAKYKTLQSLQWSDCSEHLLLDFPVKTHLIPRDGLALTHRIRARQELLEQFFAVNIVVRKDDIADQLRAWGIRAAYDPDIAAILKDLESIPQEKRVFLGMHMFGLSLQHFALMSESEVRTLMEAVLRPFGISHQILLSALGRHLNAKVLDLNANLPHGGASFGMLILQLLNGRIVSRMSKSFTPKLLVKSGAINDDALPLCECAELYIVRMWDQLELAKAGYNPERDPVGSDPEYRARIAEHASLGVASRQDFEAQVRQDFKQNQSAIEVLDAELLALVPGRMMFLADTRLPFDDPELLKLTVDNFRQIEMTEAAASNPTSPVGSALGKRGKPLLEHVTWSPVAFRHGALVRGYHHALIAKGLNFASELKIAFRREAEGFPAGSTDYFWNSPNLLVPNHAEVSAGGDDLEGPLSWRGYEFCVRNSTDESSEWVKFEYPFDDKRLLEELEKCEHNGMALRSSGDYKAADAPLRRAWLFSDRMYGATAARTQQLLAMRETNLDDLMLAQLRFRVGNRITIHVGENKGASGFVKSLVLRQHYAYEIADDSGRTFYAADNQIELTNHANGR